ncbi:MAG: ATP-binding protein [Chitinophagaceae bacterium]|nr:ATP-binding protein [Chitinophagaceae bacterium]
MKNILFLSILSLFVVITSQAQNKNLQFYHLSVENGLPKTTASMILQDRYGYIWAATSAGLVKYDGYKPKVYILGSPELSLQGIILIYEDHEGVLWVGTDHKGLFQYDRSADTFKQCIYYKENGGTGANRITRIQEDGAGNIWAISSSSANTNQLKWVLNCYDRKTGKSQRFSHSDTGNHFIDATFFATLLKDHAGQIWMGTDSGIYKYDSAINRFRNIQVKKDSMLQVGLVTLFESPSDPGILWMDYVNKNFSGGLIRYNTNNHSFTAYPTIEGVLIQTPVASVSRSPMEDTKGNLWFPDTNSLMYFDKHNNKFIHYHTNAKPVNSTVTFPLCKEDKTGNIWYNSMFGGLFYFNTQTRTFTHYLANPSNPASLQSNVIRDLLIDHRGTLWLSESNQGIQWVNKAGSQFTVYPDKTESGSNYNFGAVICYAEDIQGNIYMGTAKGLVFWNRHSDSFRLVKSLKPDKRQFLINRISSIYIDGKGIVWYGVGKNLFRFDPVSGSSKNYLTDTAEMNSNISSIYEDHKGKIWLTANFKGLYGFDPLTGRTTQVLYTNSQAFSFNPNNIGRSKELPSRRFTKIIEDSKGAIWIGTEKGLVRLNPRDSSSKVYLDEPHGLSSISDILPDKDGLMWIGTLGGGLVRFNPETGAIKQFTEKDGMLYNTVNKIFYDNSGLLWLPSPRGITVFNPVTGKAQIITTANGLPSVHLNYQTGYNNIDGGFKTSNGDFLISTTDGFIEFNPSQIERDTDPPLMYIETVSFTKPQSGNKSFGDSVLVAFGHKKFNFQYDQNRITFNYVGIHYQNADQTQYAYRLDGYDKNWINAGTNRSVTYTNLSPGTYTFHVKAANSDGVWSKETSIIIIIHSPWWQTWWAYLMYALLLVALVWGFINYRSRNLKRKNQQLEQKVSERTDELKQSLDNLKAMQKQLIQSEKMASLGELTAGIAHEIQNPLNFVNNFSDINAELIEEAGQEIDKGNVSEAKDILNDIKANEEKINHHGKRADAIVKGMLQHSRTSTGQKEPTDINALCDEYLRLAYHGMRAKDKSFNCEMKTDFDSTLPKINVVPQDIGRVILNLINNAFYACAERRNLEGFQNLQGLTPYLPTVTVSTKNLGDKVEISVKDNGNGIPEKIKDKIFQPFFTTKPTGQGTGLGLSLSYDIIKAHEGEIKVESPATGQAGERGVTHADNATRRGTEFVVILPAI